ncbi:MAG: ankyrin repeat domain-containing protein [Candidatus Babeliaceae bacterium]
MSLSRQKAITFFSIILFCCPFITLSYPYRFQRLISLEKDGKTIKKCVDFISDAHIQVPDFAKKPSMKKVKAGLLKVDEQHALSTPERTLLAALRTLNKPGRKEIDLLWEFVPNSEYYSIAEVDFIAYGGNILLQEFQDANNITFINSDTHRRGKVIFDALFNLAFIHADRGLSSEELKSITIKKLLDSLDAFFDDTPCDTNTNRQFCDLSKITDAESHKITQADWLFFKNLYQKEARPIFSNILQCKVNATAEDLRQQLLQEKNLTQSETITTMYTFMTNFEFLINILSTSKEHVIAYAGGDHCDTISQGLKGPYGWNLVIDLGFNIPDIYGVTISHRAWDYLLETPLQSLNNYKRHGDRPFINIVTAESDVLKKFVLLISIFNPRPDATRLERLKRSLKNIFYPRSDEKTLEQLQQFFTQADKTFVHFIEWRISKYDNQTLLFATVNQGLVKSTEFLLEHGARANVRDDKGLTPLFYAGPYPEIVKLLLASGADVNVKNNDNQSVYTYLNNQKNTKPESKNLVAQNKPSPQKSPEPNVKAPVAKDQSPREKMKHNYTWSEWLKKTKRSFARWIGWSKAQKTPAVPASTRP